MTHSTHKSPADILMYGHKASGGTTKAALGGSMPGNKPNFGSKIAYAADGGAMDDNNPPRFKKGGSGRPKSYMRNGRHCHAEGDSVGVNPVTGYQYPGDPANKKRGGRACHAEGDTVNAVPYKRGGRSHKRRHHEEGDEVTLGKYDGGNMADGGEAEPKKRGGVTRHRHREHHNFGDTIGKIASTFLPFLSFLKEGGSAHKRRRHHSDGDEVPLKRAMGGAGKLRKGMMG